MSHDINKEKAIEIYTRAITCLNNLTISGPSDRPHSKDSYILNLKQSGFEISVKIPAKQDGFDSSEIINIDNALTSLFP
jgi:hypothetical protein